MNLKLTTEDGTLISDPTIYRALVGKLNYLTNTRPDLSFSVQLLSQFMQQPTDIHMATLQHVLQYVKGTEGLGILLRGSDQITLHVYLDSDWASCPISRRSVTGYLILFGGSPISWRAKK